MPFRADKLPMSHNNVVGENTVLQLDEWLEFISNISLEMNLIHSCENTSVQNVLVENLQFHIFMQSILVSKPHIVTLSDI